MRDEILAYNEMVRRENISLQRGMNFRVRIGYSIVLMSVRKNAQYQDRWDEEKGILIYHGHDIQKKANGPDPKSVDQELTYPSGKLNENGKFYHAAKKAAADEGTPENIRVYEKLQKGIWSDKGLFSLVDADEEYKNNRRIYIFMLRPIPEQDDGTNLNPNTKTNTQIILPHRRLIPAHVKLEVWKRDRGQCVICGSTDNLHFDHDIPFSKGGSSLTASNVRLLCARHNLAKSDHIE